MSYWGSSLVILALLALAGLVILAGCGGSEATATATALSVISFGGAIAPLELPPGPRARAEATAPLEALFHTFAPLDQAGRALSAGAADFSCQVVDPFGYQLSTTMSDAEQSSIREATL